MLNTIRMYTQQHSQFVDDWNDETEMKRASEDEMKITIYLMGNGGRKSIHFAFDIF